MKYGKIIAGAAILMLLYQTGAQAQQQQNGGPGQEKKLFFGLNTRFRYEFQDGFNQKYYGPNPPRGHPDTVCMVFQRR